MVYLFSLAFSGLLYLLLVQAAAEDSGSHAGRSRTLTVLTNGLNPALKNQLSPNHKIVLTPTPGSKYAGQASHHVAHGYGAKPSGGGGEATPVMGVEKFGDYEVETYALDRFPKDKVSVHFGCEESEVFATNCACHIRCKDKTCRSVKEWCYQHRESHGCKFVLLRGPPHKQIATLKRLPTAAETVAADISPYPSTPEQLNGSTVWTNYLAQQAAGKAWKGPVLRDFVAGPLAAGASAEATLSELRNPGSGGARAHSLCADTSPRNASWERSFLGGGIALVALSYQTPRSLLNSMKTWKQTGLLEMVQERLAILNAPAPQELAMSAEHGFTIHQPKDFAASSAEGDGLVRTSKPNVITIGAAFYAAMKLSTSEYVLFLEKDFKMDLELSKAEIQAELLAAAGMLERGHEIIRLMSRKGKGCGTFKECGHNWAPSPVAGGPDRKRNWYSFYCPGFKGSEPYVKDCMGHPKDARDDDKTCDDARSKTGTGTVLPKECAVPRYRCFSSWDSNWSVNAVLVKRSSMLSRKYRSKDGKPVGPIADLGKSFWQQNDGFETAMGMGSLQWMNWKVPICIAYNGLFLHEEIESGA